jgi:hypothetical protein
MDSKARSAKKKEVRKAPASYVPPDLASLMIEYDDGAQCGEPSFIEAMDDVFAWMPGHMNALYGWPNDGKGTFYDFMAVMKAKNDPNARFLMMKQEDMNSALYTDNYGKKSVKVTANNIYNNLVWTLTGQTPYKHYAKKYYVPQLKFNEYRDSIDWIQERFKVIYPRNRKWTVVKDEIDQYIDMFGITHVLIDPYKSIINDLMPGEPRDIQLGEMFIQTKELTQAKNINWTWIAHPKSQSDVKEKDGRYKVVTQFLVSGGAQWDNNMDAQYSVYRPERHISASDPKVHFWNLKQKQAELVGVQRGVYEGIIFDVREHRYYFNGVCPIDGSTRENIFERKNREAKARAEDKAIKLPFADPIADQDKVPF